VLKATFLILYLDCHCFCIVSIHVSDVTFNDSDCQLVFCLNRFLYSHSDWWSCSGHRMWMFTCTEFGIGNNAYCVGRRSYAGLHICWL